MNQISYYTKLLTSEYANQPKLQQWLQVLLQPFVDAGACADTLYQAFDISNAVGAQLDMLGQIVGISRTLPFQPANGFSAVLTDSDYKTLLLATIGANFWNGLADSLQPLWQTLFPGGSIVIQDNQNMTLDVFLAGSFSSIVIDMITNGLIIPRPEGVLVNYHLGSLPLFGFDYENSYIAGFDVGKWG